MIRIGVTTGDPAGIGPEIVEKALRFHLLKKDIIYVIYGKYSQSMHGIKPVKVDSVQEAINPGVLYYIEIDDDEVSVAQPGTKSGEVAFRILEKCTEDIQAGQLHGLVTAPVSKIHITPFDKEFIGHTEYLAKKAGVDNVVMSFWGPVFDLALLSTHLGINQLSDYLTKELIESKAKLIIKEYTKISKDPKIAMLAVNPHASENGMFGNEDFILTEVIECLGSEGILIDGPFPADTFFAHHLDKYDLVISPFHDQGLIPFKMLSKSEGVNVTLGLPYYRTSVDHGTAFDIAGQDVADSRSMQSAIKWLEARLSSYQEDSRAYRVFAEYYDDYMAHVNYNLWTELVLREFKNLSGNNPTNILEIACGTATIGCNLVKKGFKVSASDNSAEMLQIGSQKKNCPQLYLADMLDPIETKHDLILCLFDSINYLTSIENVNTMLKNVRKALTANGIFVFDISTYTNSKDNFTDFINLEKSDEFVIVHEADFDSRNMLQRSNLTLMKKDMFGYKLYEENHLQKIYSLEEIQNALTSSGLKVTGLFSPHSEDNLKDLDIEVMEANFERVFYFVTKK